MQTITQTLTSRARIQTALQHREPDRVPVDVLMTPEVWHKLVKHFGLEWRKPDDTAFFDPVWEQVAARLESDMRLISYDQFCNPPESVLHAGARVEWWDALTRSTPNRMWRQWLPDGDSIDIWGHHYRVVENPTGAYEEFATYPLQNATSVEDLKSYAWAEPDCRPVRRIPARIAAGRAFRRCPRRSRGAGPAEPARRARTAGAPHARRSARGHARARLRVRQRAGGDADDDGF